MSFSTWRENRKARKDGYRDGKAGIPVPSWNNGPVPALQAIYAKHSAEFQAEREAATKQIARSVQDDMEFIAKTQEWETNRDRLQAEASSIKERLLRITDLLEGSDRESLEAKIARKRAIPTWLYVGCLLALMVGEYFVTYPALVIVFNDSPATAKIVTVSISALSVTLAHMFGISFKERLDRSTPQPPAILWGFGAVGVVFLVAVLFLSALRASQVVSTVTLGLSNAAFGTVMFFVLQTTFICAAIGLAFYNHSELESKNLKLLRKLSRVNRKIESIRRKMAKAEVTALSMGEEKVKQLNQALKDRCASIGSRYAEVCAIYVQANILNRKDHVENMVPGLEATAWIDGDSIPPLKAPNTGVEKWNIVEDEKNPGHINPE